MNVPEGSMVDVKVWHCVMLGWLVPVPRTIVAKVRVARVANCMIARFSICDNETTSVGLESRV